MLITLPADIRLLGYAENINVKDVIYLLLFYGKRFETAQVHTELAQS